MTAYLSNLYAEEKSSADVHFFPFSPQNREEEGWQTLHPRNMRGVGATAFLKLWERTRFFPLSPGGKE
jgi:hypothetical protein